MTMPLRLPLVLSLLLAVSCAKAQNPSSPAPLPPGKVPLDGSSSVDQVLDALHARGVGLNDFTADVSLAETDALTGDTTTNRGQVLYQARKGDDARLRVVFTERQTGPRVDRSAKQEYILDGQWLIELEHKKKLRVDRQVLKPGEKMNLFELGKGPFPLPIGQPKEKVTEMFEVKKAAAKSDDPAGTIHIQLLPKSGTRFARRFKSFDVWVDAKTNFPKKIETMDPNQTAVRATEFNNIQVNAGVKDEQFALPPTQGWDIKNEPLNPP